jgi:FdhE protein
MNKEDWITRHPYLRPIAEFEAQVEAAALGLPLAFAPVPDWQKHLNDFRAGVPLLYSSRPLIDLRPVATIMESVTRKLAASPLPAKLAQEIRDLEARLHDRPLDPERAVAWLVDDDAPGPRQSGMLRYIGWMVMARYLSRVVRQFDAWREEEDWLRSYCPTCGSLPAMAQLAGIESRVRHLSCGCCGTRWRFERTRCPFCENRDDHRLAVVTIEGEEGLRIDYCESCSGYLKTYAGTGSECLLLADWSSLHLDIIAGDRGLKRVAASLYAL